MTIHDLKFKYKFADYFVNHKDIRYYKCSSCITCTFQGNVVLKTINGDVCVECVKHLEMNNPDFAIGLGATE